LWKSTKVAQYKLEFILENQPAWPIWILYFVLPFLQIDFLGIILQNKEYLRTSLPISKEEGRKRNLIVQLNWRQNLYYWQLGPEIFLKSIAVGTWNVIKNMYILHKNVHDKRDPVIMNQLQRNLNGINNQWTRINEE